MERYAYEDAIGYDMDYAIFDRQESCVHPIAFTNSRDVAEKICEALNHET